MSIRRFRYLCHDSCARCSRDFKDSPTCALVVPVAGLLPPPHVGIQVCTSCQTVGLDRVLGMSVYLPGAGPRRPEQWPRYYAPDVVAGFVKCCRLDNGVVRIGLRLGHAEDWARQEVENLVTALGTMPPSAYSRDCSMYGSPELIPPRRPA